VGIVGLSDIDSVEEGVPEKAVCFPRRIAQDGLGSERRRRPSYGGQACGNEQKCGTRPDSPSQWLNRNRRSMSKEASEKQARACSA